MPSSFLNDILIKAEQLHAEGHTDRAADLYRQALQVNPSLSRTAYNLGIILNNQQDYNGAEQAFLNCLSTAPHLLEARLNLAVALQEQGKLQEALSRYQMILRTDPDCIEARFNLACLQLLLGNLTDGLPGYELRFQTNDPVRNRHQELPLWSGELRPGLRLLLYAEQGYGDTIMMLRYLPLLTTQGVKVVLEVPTPLFSLCNQLANVHCIKRDTSLPTVDYRLPIMSLPLVLGTTFDTIPDATTFLQPALQLVQHWKGRLHTSKPLRIGLAWAGRLDLPVNCKRSCPPELLRPLLELDRIEFVSLQNCQVAELEFNDPCLLDCRDELTDFHQTAALIANLDLVISIDTAVAHLAGTLGVPTWLMLPAVPDWRWLLDRTDSPWYPSMQLFRQPTPGAWSPVVSAIRDKLADISSPRIWTYRVGQDFDPVLTNNRPTPLSDTALWPELGLREAASPETADWLLFPYYLEYLTEYRTIEGMWSFLKQLPWFRDHQERHLLFNDHDSEAQYHSSALWFRASINPERRDPHSFSIPYQISIPDAYLHFEPAKISCHISFTGYLGQQRERAALINGIITEQRLVHKLDLSTAFHLHQSVQVQEERRKRYLETSSASICILCPRGEGTSSLRFFEALALGRIPVIQEPMLLPFTDRIDYTRFVISIPQDKTEQAGTIVFNWLASLNDTELMQRCHEARAAWAQHLSPQALAKGIVRHICQCALSAPKRPPKLQDDNAGDWQQPLHKAAAMILEGRFTEARQLLGAASERNPRSALILVTRGAVEQELGNDHAAEACLRDAILYDHRYYDAYLLLGNLLARTGRPVEAVGRYYQASLLRPDEPAPYQLAIPLMQQLGRQDEAVYCQERLNLLHKEGTPP